MEDSTGAELDDSENMTFTDDVKCDMCQKKFAFNSKMNGHKVAKHPQLNKKEKHPRKRPIEEEMEDTAKEEE